MWTLVGLVAGEGGHWTGLTFLLRARWITVCVTGMFNESAGRGRQMLPGGCKSKSALPSGYFSDAFSRVLEGEAYTDQVKMRRQDRLREAQRNIGKPFLPTSGEKKM